MNRKLPMTVSNPANNKHEYSLCLNPYIYILGELARHLEHSGASSLFTVPLLVSAVNDALETDDNLKKVIKVIILGILKLI